MNREIKFRVFCERFGLNTILPVTKMTVGSDGTWFHADVASNHREVVHSESGKVMQFTGLKDKNGVEIYEGDVLRSWYIECLMQSTAPPESPNNFGPESCVGFHQLTDRTFIASCDLSPENELINGGLTDMPDCWDEEQLFGYITLGDLLEATRGIKVVGNIYENPELLS